VPRVVDAIEEATTESPAPGPVEETEPDSVELAFENGLARRVVIGGIAGFSSVLALVTLTVYYMSDAGLPAALGCALFVAFFGGLGYGSMMAASTHKPSAPRPS
jgi:hypothetical protein